MGGLIYNGDFHPMGSQAVKNISPNWNKSKFTGKTDPGPIQPFASTQDTVFLCIIIWAKRPKKGEKIRQLLQGTKMRKAGNSCFKLTCPLKRNYFNKNYMSSNHWLRGTCYSHESWILNQSSPDCSFPLWNHVSKIPYAQQLTFQI